MKTDGPALLSSAGIILSFLTASVITGSDYSLLKLPFEHIF